MSTLSQYIGDTDIIVRFRVRQLRVAVLVLVRRLTCSMINTTNFTGFRLRQHSVIRPVERGGKFFPGPATFGARHRSY